MPILYVFLGIALVGAPLFTQHMYRECWLSERHQIATDNAGIILGEAMRSTANYVENMSRRLKKWDEWHHVVHVCARVPSPKMVACQGLDRAYEKSLLLWHEAIRVRAGVKWNQARQTAKQEAERLESELTISRFLRPRLRAETCKRCRLTMGWQVLSHTVPLGTRGPEGRELSLQVRLAKFGEGPWRYQIDD